jgi:NAD-dependent SIR2 family protein deacetylase
MLANYNQRIEKAHAVINSAKHIVIGAGSGLSTAAGLDYSGKRFHDNFKPFIERFGFRDLYTSSFYPFKTQEERWAYWAKHISFIRYETAATELYTNLLTFARTKNYFVITTNVDGQFEKANVHKNKFFEVQGNYAYLQCSVGCHDKLYNNEALVAEMLGNIENCRIPTDLVPKCPKCGHDMDVNLRKDQYFVQDKNWHKAESNYNNFVSGIKNEPIVFVELGVGYNTPGIIRYPFETMVCRNPNATLIRINKDYPEGLRENQNSTIAFTEEIKFVLNDIK